MMETLIKYKSEIQSGKIDPAVQWDGKASTTIFNPADPNTPLNYAGLNVWNLEQGPINIRTDEREYVLVPMSGEFEIAVGDSIFAGSRPGGPFATEPELSNASAVYLGRNQTGILSGKGEMIGFSAPALTDRPPAFIKPGRHKQRRHGEGIWHGEVIPLAADDEITSNLTVGEVYCPAGAWYDMPDQGNHEAIYYYMIRTTTEPSMSFGAQFLFDGQTVDKTYLVRHRTAVAIPGGNHPTVAGPYRDLMIAWARVSVR